MGWRNQIVHALRHLYTSERLAEGMSVATLAQRSATRTGHTRSAPTATRSRTTTPRNDGGSTEPCEAGPSRDPPLMCNARAILCNEQR